MRVIKMRGSGPPKKAADVALPSNQPMQCEKQISFSSTDGDRLHETQITMVDPDAILSTSLREICDVLAEFHREFHRLQTRRLRANGIATENASPERVIQPGEKFAESTQKPPFAVSDEQLNSIE